MPDETGPMMEMAMTQTPKQRMRHAQRPTLSSVMTEIRAEVTSVKSELEARLAALMTELEAVRALALAQGERRTEDLKRLVSEVVKEEIAAQLDLRLKPVIDLLPALQLMVADHEKRVAEDKEHEASMVRLIGVLRTLTIALENGWEGVKPLIYGLLGVLLASKAQSISTWPQSVFWIAAGLIIAGSIAWPRLLKRLRVPRSATPTRREEDNP